MGKKLRVGVLFGGRSGEHEVSLRSADSVLQAIDRRKYEVVPIGIEKTGRWVSGDRAMALLRGEAPAELAAKRSKNTSTRQAHANAVSGVKAALLGVANGATSGTQAGARGSTTAREDEPAGALLQAVIAGVASASLDVVFPVLHGTFGEDGTIQGLLELANVAYVGSGVLGSAAGMDKDAMKKMFQSAGLPVVPHVTLLRGEWQANPRRCTRLIEAQLAYPVFVKPANLGSSVGISKVRGRQELALAMDEASRFDRKIVVEEGVSGTGSLRGSGKARELEVAVLGNDEPTASVVGEIVPDREFYDYASKYDAGSTSEPVIPAKLTRAQVKHVQALAIQAFRSCDLSGLARVDFLMEAADPASAEPPRLFLNEVNTMPGFTSISMYPKLWEASGLPYPRLIDQLIVLARERHTDRQNTRYVV